MPVRLSRRFLKAYDRLPVRIQTKVDKAVELLDANPRHPSLQAKPIHHAPGIYECRVDQNYRLTYERLEEDILYLRVVGPHDETLARP